MVQHREHSTNYVGIMPHIFISLALVLLMTVLLLWLIDVGSHDPLKFFDAKLTFISIVFAAALIQYNYFHVEYLSFYTDIVPVWDRLNRDVVQIGGDQQIVEFMEENAIAGIDQARENLAYNQTLIQARINQRNEGIVAANADIKHFTRALSLYFAVGTPIMVSVLADLVAHFVFYSREIYAVSFAGFFIGLFWFIWLCAYYAGVVIHQLANVQSKVEEYDRR
jgi:hypothetical protein